MFLLHKEDYLIFNAALQDGLVNITFNKVYEKMQSDNLVTTAFVFLCIISNIGNMKGSQLTLNLEKNSSNAKILNHSRCTVKGHIHYSIHD